MKTTLKVRIFPFVHPIVLSAVKTCNRCYLVAHRGSQSRLSSDPFPTGSELQPAVMKLSISCLCHAWVQPRETCTETNIIILSKIWEAFVLYNSVTAWCWSYHILVGRFLLSILSSIHPANAKLGIATKQTENKTEHLFRLVNPYFAHIFSNCSIKIEPSWKKGNKDESQPHLQFTKKNVPISKVLETSMWKTQEKSPEEHKEMERVKNGTKSAFILKYMVNVV